MLLSWPHGRAHGEFTITFVYLLPMYFFLEIAIQLKLECHNKGCSKIGNIIHIFIPLVHKHFQVYCTNPFYAQLRFSYIHFGSSVKASSIIHVPMRTSSKAETHLRAGKINNILKRLKLRLKLILLEIFLQWWYVDCILVCTVPGSTRRVHTWAAELATKIFPINIDFLATHS